MNLVKPNKLCTWPYMQPHILYMCIQCNAVKDIMLRDAHGVVTGFCLFI